MRFDNNMISITGMGFEDFEKAMSFFDLKNIKGFEVNKKKGLMLYWAEHERMTSMPFEHTVGGIVNFSWEWLQASSAAAEGVAARTSATISQMVKSISCPTAEITGIFET